MTTVQKTGERSGATRRPSVKLPLAEGCLAPDRNALTEAFHRLVQQQGLPGGPLIDVADYRHVHQGPGLLLIAHEGHYAFEASDGVLGATYHHHRGGGRGEEQLLALSTDRARRLAEQLTRALRLQFEQTRPRVRWR